MEYQYYEFQAIDRPLEEADKDALRRISSRAEITSRRFTNVYNWGDLRGSPRKLMERWFDLHLYLANWGTRRVMFRISKHLIDLSRLDAFVGEVSEVEWFESGENLIVDIQFDSEESGCDYSSFEEGEGWLDCLAPLRNDIAAGGLRLFYILWLTVVEMGTLADDVEEPLAGIGPLSAPLEAFTNFIRVDRDLVQAAAESPTNSESGLSFAQMSRRAIASIPENEKTDLLLHLVNGDAHIASEIRNKIRSAWDAAEGTFGGESQTVAEIRDRSTAVRDERRAEEAERREAERLRKAREAERAQAARLESIGRRGERVWHEVEREIEGMHASGYDRALELLVDLRVLARQQGTVEAFEQRIQSIRRRHARKWRFSDRLDEQRMGLDSLGVRVRGSRLSDRSRASVARSVVPAPAVSRAQRRANALTHARPRASVDGLIRNRRASGPTCVSSGRGAGLR